jgi:GAF domain-containing protein
LAELFVVNGICSGTVFFLPDVPTVVGRSLECHVQIGDPWISSMHALFERRGEQLWVVDLDSRNGTFLGEERVQEAPLNPGARLRFGRTEAELRAGPEAAEQRGNLGETTIIRYLADLVGESAAPPAPTEIPGLVPPRQDRPSRVTASGRRQVAVLNEIGRITMSSGDAGETLRLVLRVLSGAVRAERASVLLLDERGEMVPQATEPPGAAPRVSDTVVQAAMRSRAGILTTDAQQDARFSGSQSIIAQGIRSCMAAPIWADNRILGTLVLDRGLTDPFTAEDLELATVVGFQAALAVERSRQRDRARLADEQRLRLLRHLPAPVAGALLASDSDREILAPGPRPEAVVLRLVLGCAGALAAERPAGEAAARLFAAQEAARQVLLGEGAAVDARLTGDLVAVFGLEKSDDGTLPRALRAALAARDRVRELEAGMATPRLAPRCGLEAGRCWPGTSARPSDPSCAPSGRRPRRRPASPTWPPTAPCSWARRRRRRPRPASSSGPPARAARGSCAARADGRARGARPRERGADPRLAPPVTNGAAAETWEATPAPKIVVAVGACAISGGPFAGSPVCLGGADGAGADLGVPVDLYVPGCPPHPVTVMDGLLRLLGRLEGDPLRLAGTGVLHAEPGPER